MEQNDLKVICATVSAFLSAKFGIVYPLIQALFCLVILDYCSGRMASRITTGLSSKVGFKGIVRKLGYFVCVVVALTLDWLILVITKEFGIQIQIPMFICALVTIWLILNELLSILENINRSGVKTPPFLKDIIKFLLKRVENEVKPIDK